MIKFFITSISISILFVFISCHNEHTIIEGSFPIDSLTEIKLVNIMTGEEVLTDTVVPSSFSLRTDGMPQGIYLAEFTWDRHQLKPKEIKERARYEIEELPKYYFSKAIWIDHDTKQHITLSMAKDLTQPVLEGMLFDQTGELQVLLETSGDNGRLFEEFLHISFDFYANNLVEKEKLKAELYLANEAGNYEKSKILQKQVDPAWIPEIKRKMQEAEIAYLQKYNRSVFIPYVLYGRVGSQEDFHVYKPVYDGLDTPVKEKVGAWFSKFMN